jgi:hypothetical protein
MSATPRAARRSSEPVRAASADHASPTEPLVRRIGRVRVPLSLTRQPWANAYRLPNGTTVWCLRLWQDGRVVRAVVSTATLRGFAVRSGLSSLVVAIDAAAAGARD